MPNEAEIDHAVPDLRKVNFGKVPLECVMLDQPLKRVAYPPVGLFPTFCLDPGQNSLRITTEFGSLTFFRNRMGTFQSRSVATEIIGDEGTLRAITGHVSALSSMTMNDSDFVPTADMEPGRAISQPQPVYPVSAKQNHVTGTVVLHAIIGRDGRIHSLHVTSTPDPDLAIAAIYAVRRWVYKPYTLNGMPTEVETTVNVNFSMSQ